MVDFSPLYNFEDSKPKDKSQDPQDSSKDKAHLQEKKQEAKFFSDDKLIDAGINLANNTFTEIYSIFNVFPFLNENFFVKILGL